MIVGTVGIAHEEQAHALFLQHNLLASETLAKPSQGHYIHQLFSHGRHVAEAVNKTAAVACQLLVVLEAVKFSIEQHPLAVLWHIILREIHLDVTLQCTVIDKEVTSQFVFLHLFFVQV